MLVVMAIGISSGCNKNEMSPPSVNITGIWAGKWEGNTETDHGNILFEVLQDGSELDGEMFFREDLPGLANSGTDIEGTVFGNEINFRQTSGSENSFHGVVDGHVISGEDSFYSHGIASDGMYIYSSYHGKISKILINNPDDLEVINTPDIDPSKLCFDGEYFRVIDFFSIHIHLLSKSGTLLSTQENHGLGSGIAFDGTNIWILQFYPAILIKYGDDGELLEAYNLPKSLNNNYSYHDLAYDGQNFWVLVHHYSEDFPWKYYLYKLGDE